MKFMRLITMMPMALALIVLMMMTATTAIALEDPATFGDQTAIISATTATDSTAIATTIAQKSEVVVVVVDVKKVYSATPATNPALTSAEDTLAAYSVLNMYNENGGADTIDIVGDEITSQDPTAMTVSELEEITVNPASTMAPTTVKVNFVAGDSVVTADERGADINDIVGNETASATADNEKGGVATNSVVDNNDNVNRADQNRVAMTLAKTTGFDDSGGILLPVTSNHNFADVAALYVKMTQDGTAGGLNMVDTDSVETAIALPMDDDAVGVLPETSLVRTGAELANGMNLATSLSAMVASAEMSRLSTDAVGNNYPNPFN